MRGKNLKIFLLDGIPNGRWICELSNWTGKAFKIPRTYYKLCKERQELRAPSLYFLFGHNDDTGRPVIYIGETEDAIQRLGEHIQGKDYWTEAIVFINKDDHLNKAHIKYLESRFYEITASVNRYDIMNTQPPKRSLISEAEQDEMEDFIDNAKIIVSALGHKVFEMLIPVALINNVESEVSDNDVEYLWIKNRNGIDAKGFISPEGFVICKGSSIREQLSAKSIGKNILKLREQYLNDGTVVENVLVRDTLFTSPSAASDFILGNSTSGKEQWKNSDGISLKELYRKV